jgi:hypothetical protein
MPTIDKEGKPSSCGLFEIGGMKFLSGRILAQSHAHVSLMKKTMRKVTPQLISTYFKKSGLTLQDFFTDNPERTLQYFGELCAKIIKRATEKKITDIPAVIDHLQEWKSTLENGAPKPLWDKLHDTIVTLQDLVPDADDLDRDPEDEPLLTIEQLAELQKEKHE